MKFFDKLFSKETVSEPEKKQTPSAEKKSTSPHELVVSMLKLAEITVLKGDYEAAFKLYQTIVEMEQNADAQYNLGNLYAMGKGTDRDFLQAAYWFYQAELNGEAEAKRLCKRAQWTIYSRIWKMPHRLNFTKRCSAVPHCFIRAK